MQNSTSVPESVNLFFFVSCNRALVMSFLLFAHRLLPFGNCTLFQVAKYKPAVPVLTVAVPLLTTDALSWTCSGEQPARQCLFTRGLLPLLAEGSTRAADTDTTDSLLQSALEHAVANRYCIKGDCVIALHRIGPASIIKIIDIK
mmetsp:Transcript_18590/g.47611  ORF Transcript_18590/g.47611 Transcript_18590/m.47611 type:complete len:145 (-) Transcript_18590:89-523(-)